MQATQKTRPTLARMTSGCLAVLILLLGIASVSPQTHEAFHVSEESHQCGGGGRHHHDPEPVDGCEAPVCAVNFFDNGATSVLPIVELPERTDVIVAIVSLAAEAVWCGQAPIRCSSRAPPIESVV